MSSSAMPGIFPFVEFKNNIYTDGGMLKNFDVIGGIEHCLK